MNKSTQKSKPRKKKPWKGKLPVSVVQREDKTTIRQFEGRRFVRMGEVRNKKVAWVEIYTCAPDGHNISIMFQDRTVLYLWVTPFFNIRPKLCNARTDDLEVIKQWKDIKSET